MKTELYIIIIMAFLTSATLFLIYQSPDDTPKSISFEKYSNELVQINELSKKYQLMEDERFENSKRLMQEKLKEMSLDYLKIKISDVTLLEGQYPFWDVQYRIDRFDLEPSSICDFEQNMPLHMKKILQTDNFQKFAKKYSTFPIELDIFDERNLVSNIHYGLIATNNENQSASTHFHLDTCTNEISDKESYFLSCRDENNDYKYGTFNTNDIISSLSSVEFCKIELDSWRQSLYDYFQILREDSRQLELQSIANEDEDEVAFGPPFSEMNRLGNLKNIVGNMVHGKFDEQSTKEKIIEYENLYGSLPDELLELIEIRK